MVIAAKYKQKPCSRVLEHATLREIQWLLLQSKKTCPRKRGHGTHPKEVINRLLTCAAWMERGAKGMGI